MVDMRAYRQPVRRSLLQREMLGGIPQAGLILLFILGVVFVYRFRFYWMIVPIVLLYFFMRHLTKKDQWLIDNFMEHLTQKDIYLP